MSSIKNAIPVILASVVSSLIVGLGSSYLTANATIAVFEERLDKAENRLRSLETAKEKAVERDGKLSERLIRVETKIDVLLKRPQ